MSSLPYSSTAPSATTFTCSNSETSAGMAMASPPLSRISSTRESSPFSLLALTTTLAPLLANRRAVSRPMPLEAPITPTTCSSMGFNLIAFSFPCRSRPRRGLVRSSFAKEITQDRREPLRLLDVGEVAAVGDEFERTVLQAGNRLLGLPVGEHPVLNPPHYKRRHL